MFNQKLQLKRKMIAAMAVVALFFGLVFSAPSVEASAGWTAGKFDKSYDYNGQFYIDAGNVFNGVKTVAFWTKGSAYNGIVVDLNGSAYISISAGGTVSATGWTSPTIYIDGIAGTTVDANWHFVMVTTDTAINASAVKFGSVALDNLVGTLDDVKMYNYALSAREVNEKYRQDAPSMAQGGEISDSSVYTALTVTQSGTGKIVNFIGDSVTTGKGIALSADGLTIGSAMDISSTSTAFNSGKLLNLSASGALGSAGTVYGLYSNLTGANANNTNIAGYFSATGAGSTNYGLIVENGLVGFGTITPDSPLEIYDTATQFKLSYDGSNSSSFAIGATGVLTVTTAGTGTDIIIADDNFKVCAGGACPSLTMNGTGNLLVENTVFADKFDKCWRDDDGDGASDWITVPGNQKFGTDDFCVMKYEASNGGATTATSDIANAPWVSISQTTAIAECAELGAGFHLMTEPEWMTVAYNITQTPINDLDADAGLQLATGHSDNAPASALAAIAGSDPVVSGCVLTSNMENASNAYSADSCEIQGDGSYGGDATDMGFYGTSQAWSATGYSSGAANKAQLRTHVLSNGDVIWDIAGNVWEWTNATIPTADRPACSVSQNWCSYFVDESVAGGIRSDWGVLDDLSNVVGSGQMFAHSPYSASGAKTLEEIIKPIEYDPYNLDVQLSGTSNGIGRIYTGGTPNPRAFLRGGYWGFGAYAGVFTLYLGHAPSSTSTSFGFRCAR